MSNNKNFNKKYDKNEKPNTKKTARRPKVNPNEFKVPLHLSADLSLNVIDEILDVLASTRFDKISIPVGTYRCLVDTNSPIDDNRVSTIGYIKGYDPDTNVFTIVVFNTFNEFMTSHDGIYMDLHIIANEEGLKTITKFVLTA